MHSFRLLTAVTVLGLATFTPFAQSVPSTINYQGRLTDNTPSQAPLNATVNMAFEIWDAPSGGTRLWLEPNSGSTPVVVTGGIFNVLLGASAGASSVPIPATVFTTGTTARYLQVIANGETLTPRQTIGATGYANQAQNASTAASATSATTATTATNSAQLGGIASGSWQRSLSLASCAAGQFYSAIAQNGAASCASAQTSITPPLTLSGTLATPVISGTNSGTTSPTSSGVYGENSSTAATVFGVHGKISNATPGLNSAGVRGENLGTSSNTFGVWGSHAGTGVGVYGTAAATANAAGVEGHATAATGTSIGVYGLTNSPTGFGVYGTGSVGSGYGVFGLGGAFGVYGSTLAGGATGVYGTNTGAGSGFGVQGVVSGTGTGVYGENSSTNNPAYGVHGKISNTAGGNTSAGVFGENLTASGVGFGVYGLSAGGGWGVLGSASGTTGSGIRGSATAASGLNYGVHGSTLSPGGFAGYFSNGTPTGTALRANSGGGLIFDGQVNGVTRFNWDGFGTANFGSATRQMLNLWGAPDGNDTAQYGMGVQASTVYFRTGGGYAWFLNGTHSDTGGDPGAGGAALMSLSSTGVLAVTALGSAGSTALCRNASNQISTCSSSLRYKTNLKPFSDGLNLLDRLKPITFDWKADHMPDVGFGAEDVAAVNPLFVTYNAQGQVEGVKYDRLNVLLVNGVRELQDQIKTQQGEIAALKTIVCADHPDASLCAEKP